MQSSCGHVRAAVDTVNSCPDSAGIPTSARLLRERGVDGASVNDVMKDAGLTHGGFYKHFPNKDAMVASALDAAFATFIAMLEGGGADAANATESSTSLTPMWAIPE